MIKKQTPKGQIVITDSFFIDLVSNVIGDCYGVAGMSTTGTVQSIKTLFFKKETSKKGVKVVNIGENLIIDLHIVVLYGVNISAIVKSIVHKVKYSVEDITGFTVEKINVFVDGMLPE
ncbi:MAG: Asp23/Gls24 family envelope stress response protein [Clostridia bacterium]